MGVDVPTLPASEATALLGQRSYDHLMEALYQSWGSVQGWNIKCDWKSYWIHCDK